MAFTLSLPLSFRETGSRWGERGKFALSLFSSIAFLGKYYYLF